MEYDFAVIGGGSAGYAGARTAAEFGLKTVIVDGAQELGGLCILRGCMPSKTLLESARRFRVIQRAEEFGLSVKNAAFNTQAIIERKRKLIAEFADYRRSQLESGRFDLVRGHAVFSGANELTVHPHHAESFTIRAKTFLIATGSDIAIPSVSGLAEAGCLTSDEMLDLEQMPDSLVVLGAGPVALEMASYCRAFGSRVTIVQRSPQILSGIDADVAAALEGALREDGIELHTGTQLLRVERHSNSKLVVFNKNGTAIAIEARQVLNALGRNPSLGVIGSLGLETKKGRLLVDSSLRTSLPHIFAAGDVCASLEVVHIAIQQAEIAAANAALHLGKREGEPRHMDYRLKLFAVFSEPQLAVVGATEADLRLAEKDFITATYPFNDHGKSMLMGETAGMVKLTAARSNGEILGGAVVGPEASELIHEVVVAMRYRATVHDLAAIPHYHPTLSEIWTYPAEEIAGILSS
jgi:pyruvate/2-oxoglutarate dehydrogenase complex dihydrolipoamide dehydrogenase (E3) component